MSLASLKKAPMWNFKPSKLVKFELFHFFIVKEILNFVLIYEIILLFAVPTSPIDITVLKSTSDSVTLSWRPPSRTNGILKGYKVEFTNSRLKYPLPSWCLHTDEINRSITLPANIREYSVQKLSAFTEYAVTVYAGTKVGFGLSSKTLVSTLPSGKLKV